MPQNIVELIVRRRRQLLVHRYCYYVRSESLIDDLQYDILERELRQLVEQNVALADTLQYADDCPIKTVGSSNLWDYPRELQYIGDALIDWVRVHPDGKPTLEYDESEEAEQPSIF